MKDLGFSYQKHFYAHLIDLEDLQQEMQRLEIPEDEHEKLLGVVHKTIQVEVHRFILDELDEKHHSQYLQQLESKPHDRGLWVFLERAIENFEHRLKHTIQQVKQDFKEELDRYEQASKEWLEVW